MDVLIPEGAFVSSLLFAAPHRVADGRRKGAEKDPVPSGSAGASTEWSGLLCFYSSPLLLTLPFSGRGPAVATPAWFDLEPTEARAMIQDHSAFMTAR